MKANQVLAEIYLAESKLDEALTLLEALFEYQPAAARPRLIQALLMKAVEETVENKKLAIYEKALKIDPNQPEALSAYQEIWEKKGDRAYKKGNFKEALEAYTKVQVTAKMKAADRRVKIEQDYLQALQELKRDARRKAQKLLAKVLFVEPTFREAARYMYLAVTGVDPVAKIEELERLVKYLSRVYGTPAPLETFEFEMITINERGKEIKRDRGETQQWVEELGNGIILEMVAIPGGTFVMGAPETEKGRSDYEGSQHQVTVAPFYMGKFPITQEQWEVIMKNNPSKFKGAKRPVEMISWNDAVKF